VSQSNLLARTANAMIQTRTKPEASGVSRPRGRLIHWPIVVAAAIPCPIFVGTLVAVVAAVLVPRHSASNAPAVPQAREEMKAESAEPETFVAQIHMRTHQPMQAVPLSASAQSRETESPTLAALEENQEEPGDPATELGGLTPTPVAQEPVCQKFGTAVQFVNSPTEAYQQALKQKKLVYILHVSGNFEDSKFT
jgi:hypothetical protein